MAARSKSRARRKSVTQRKPRTTARKKTKAKVSRSRATKQAARRKRTTPRKKSAAKKKHTVTTRKAAAARTTNATPVAPKLGHPKPSAQKPPAVRGTQPAAPAAAPAKPGSATSAAPASATPASVASTVPELVGRITHYFAHVNAGVIALEHGVLRVGDTVHIRGHTTDFYQRLEHIEVDHRPIELARAGQSVGIQVAQRVREHDQVFKVSK
jgi:hypothetical protein